MNLLLDCLQHRKKSYEKYLTHCQMISEDCIEAYGDERFKRYLKYEEELSNTFKKQFPETLFILNERRICLGIKMDKNFECYFKRDHLYDIKFEIESFGRVGKFNTYLNICLEGDWGKINGFLEGHSEFQKQIDIIDAFKNLILDLNEYRLLNITGMIK